MKRFAGGALTLLFASALAVGQPPIPAQAATACTIVGTSGDDVILGTAKADVICGLGGADTLKGLRGPDVLIGGAGPDQLLGGRGNDSFDGGTGYNTCLQSYGTGPQTACQASDWKTTETSYPMGVLVLKFFPIASDGLHIDINVTGDVGDLVSDIRTKVRSIDTNLVNDLTLGSAYHGYANAGASPSLTYGIVHQSEFDTAVPTEPNPGNPTYSVRPDYGSIMTDNDICTWVDHRGVNEVWMWAYQGPSQLGISESKMSGPHGDISNSARLNDMPLCKHTYTVYTYNYGRGTGEALESHGHQLEAELSYVNATLFTGIFEGPAYPGTTTDPGRCGSVHNPPNARFEYDRYDTKSHPSDCLAWNPNSLGPLTDISCLNWTCTESGDTHNPVVDYLVWWMQNFPGIDNAVKYGGRQMRNWWDVHAAWDDVLSTSDHLTL